MIPLPAGVRVWLATGVGGVSLSLAVLHHQDRPPYQPNGGCRQTRCMGAAWLFAIFRWRCGFGSGAFDPVDCTLSVSVGCSSANASRALTGTSAVTAGVGMLASASASCEGVIGRMLVSKTTRSGHLSSE